MLRRLALVVIVAAAGIATASHADAASSAGSTKLNWTTNSVTTLTVTPNFQTGFGPQGGTGSGSTPAPGPSAVLNGGYVDFGSVVAGYRYIYKYAAALTVASNDPSGFTVYGEGSGNFIGGSNTLAIANTLFWLPTATTNTQFSPATSFSATTNTVTNAGADIAYGGTPPAAAAIWSSSTPASPSVTKDYDYELNVPYGAPIAAMSLYVVYTVVAN